MSKEVYLVLVDETNETAPVKGNNKYYRMLENGDGTWTAKYGRVGGGAQSRTYPMSRWDKKYREKLRKGYKDITELKQVSESKVEVDAEDPLVANLLEDLYRASHNRATSNYRLASFGAVTQPMLNEAQAIIDEIAKQIGLTTSVTWYRDRFLDLYTVIPRRMDNVEDYLPQVPGDSKVRKLVESEQETLESLRGQVVTAQGGENVKLLDVLGITIEPLVAQYEQDFLNEIRFRRGFSVKHSKTEQAFQKFKDLNTKFLYHGSRRSNWLSILESGLQIRPAANGTMYGNGIYFADDINKSRSYTDAYIGVYEVAIGKPQVVRRSNSRLALDNINGDSVKAESRYNEYVIFRPQQCTVRYLLDVR